MPARVHRDEARAAAQRVRNFRPHPLAEAVRVVRERERAGTAEIEQRDLDAPLGEREAPRRCGGEELGGTGVLQGAELLAEPVDSRGPRAVV